MERARPAVQFRIFRVGTLLYVASPELKEICTIIIIVRRSEFFRMPVSSYVPGKEQDSLHQDLEPIATF